MPNDPPSPQKRVTRARARAAEVSKSNVKTTRITTPAAKAAAKNVKRKAQVDEAEAIVEPEVTTVSTTKAATTKKSAAVKSDANKVLISATKTLDSQPVAPRPRGRPRKNPLPVEDNEPEQAESIAPRTRATTTIKPAHDRLRKKVTFQNSALSDKENELPGTLSSKSGKAKDRGAVDKNDTISAKPKGQQAISRTVTTGIKQKGAKSIDNLIKSRGEPLSPKKDKQVAKVAPQPQENENRGSPFNQLLKSPMKPPCGSLLQSPERGQREIPFTNTALSNSVDLESSTRDNACIMTGSPARRPPPSPFKDSMRNAAIKLGGSGAELGLEGVFHKHDSMLSLSPAKKFNPVGTQPVFESTSSRDLASSLFQSPAKRPAVAMQRFTPKLPSKMLPESSVMSAMTSTAISGSARRPALGLANNSSRLIGNAWNSPASSKENAGSPKKFKEVPENKAGDASGFVSSKEPGNQRRPESPSVPRNESGTERPTSSGSGSRIPIRSPPKFSGLGTNVSTFRGSTSAGLSPVSTPAKLTKNQKRRSLFPKSPAAQFAFEDESEDELQSNSPQPITPAPLFTRLQGQDQGPFTPAMNSEAQSSVAAAGPMTILAQKLNNWKGATPNSGIIEQRKTNRSVFAPIYVDPESDEGITSTPKADLESDEIDFFDETMPIQGYESSGPMDLDEHVEVHNDENTFRQSQVSDVSQEYGDENAIPIDPLLHQSYFPAATCTPAKVFQERPQEIHTVCKVPLKPADDVSPVTRLGRRSHSLSAALSPQADLNLQLMRQLHPSRDQYSELQDNISLESKTSQFQERLQDVDSASMAYSMDIEPTTPSPKPGLWSAAATPARTPRPGLDPKLLAGVVAYIDVHTSEGADASGIFLELLSQMGAKCVKQWNWNPRNAVENNKHDEPKEGCSNRIGITHVVFKDGGKRTMEKVREAGGVVQCVGVGWVLDCERENKWLEEGDYAIDVTTIPRGGHRRRKSMEPRAISGRKSSFESPQKGTSNISPTKEFLNLSSPVDAQNSFIVPIVDRRVSFAPLPQSESPEFPATPARQYATEPFETPTGAMADSTFDSPTTPYFLHPQQLVQKTCPPKQSQQLLFPISGRIQDQPSSAIRQRLLHARRKSLQFAPKIGSPLARRDE